MSTSSHTSTLSRTIAAATVAMGILAAAAASPAFAASPDMQGSQILQQGEHIRAARNQYGMDSRGEAVWARPAMSDQNLNQHDQWPCSTAPEFCSGFHGYNGG